MRWMITLLLALCSLFALAQTGEIEKLEKKLKAAKTEKEKLEISVTLSKTWLMVDFDKGKKMAETGYQTAIKIKNIDLEGQFLNVLAIVEMYSGNTDSAFVLFRKGISTSRIAKNKLTEEKIYANMGSLFEFIGEYDSAFYYFDRSLKMSIARKDTVYIADTYNSIGLSYSNIGQFDSSYTYLQRSYQLYQLIGKKEGMADATFNIANIYFYQNKFNKSLDLFIEARDIYDSLHVENKASQARMNIAQIMFNSKKYEDARRELYVILPVFKRSENNHDLGNVHFILANTFEEEQQYDSASFHYQKAQEAFRKAEDKNGLGSALSSMGIMLLHQGKTDEAIVFFKDALKNKIQAQDPEGMGAIHNGLSEAYQRKKQFDLALYHCLEGIGYLEKTGAKGGLSQMYLRAADLSQEQGNFANAYGYIRKHLSLRDSLESEEDRNALAKLEAQYNTKEEKNKNELLRQQNLAKDAEIKLKDEEEHKKNILLYGALTIVLLFVVLLSIIIRANRQRKRANEILAIRNEEIIRQNTNILLQKDIIEEKQKEITDSINYAKRIQFTLLAHDALMKEHLPEHFVLFLPKDIVSGDFYWATHTENGKFFMAVCDSTGHGVPGAFMSLLNISFLNEAINEKHIHDPGKILDHARANLIEHISQQGQKDGMDGVVFCWDKKNLIYSAAHNNPIIVRQGEIIELAADKMPVGMGEREDPFSTHSPELKKGDMIYFFTDGFADQFGGPKGKKFKYSNFYQLLASNAELSCTEQSQKLEHEFKSWKGDLEQIDDVCVLGMRI